MQAIDASENVDFNLHTHVECNSPLLPDPKTIVISTHALTWSATPAKWQQEYRKSFQLTHSRGVRLLRVPDIQSENEFQLTHSRGVRRVSLIVKYPDEIFQLTHSRGVRRNCKFCRWSKYTFQLTHSRGVRRVAQVAE